MLDFMVFRSERIGNSTAVLLYCLLLVDEWCSIIIESKERFDVS